MFNARSIDRNSIPYDRNYIGYFKKEWFENTISKIENPVILTDIKTILKCVKCIKSDDKVDMDAIFLLFFEKDADKINLIRDIILNTYRFNIEEKYYRMYGKDIPLETSDDVDSELFVYNKENHVEFIHYKLC